MCCFNYTWKVCFVFELFTLWIYYILLGILRFNLELVHKQKYTGGYECYRNLSKRKPCIEPLNAIPADYFVLHSISYRHLAAFLLTQLRLIHLDGGHSWNLEYSFNMGIANPLSVPAFIKVHSPKSFSLTYLLPKWHITLQTTLGSLMEVILPETGQSCVLFWVLFWILFLAHWCTESQYVHLQHSWTRSTSAEEASATAGKCNTCQELSKTRSDSCSLQAEAQKFFITEFFALLHKRSACWEMTQLSSISVWGEGFHLFHYQIPNHPFCHLPRVSSSLLS